VPRHPAPPDLDAAAARLAERVAALAGDHLREGQRLALAVSGGADSLALMAVARRAFPERAVVLTVDHGLRPEAAAEGARVVALAAAVGLEAVPLAAVMAPGDGIQARARTARYRAIGAWCAAARVPVVLTAHHADDQAETFLMRAARGSGLSGLAGIRPVVDLFGVRVVRPLLDVPRADLAAIVVAEGWQPADDPSNRDPRFDRTAARALLAATPWLEPSRIAAASAHLRAADEALAWATDAAWRSRVTARDGQIRIDGEGLPQELQRRLLLAAFVALGAEAPEGPMLERFRARLEGGGAATVGGVRARAGPARLWTLGRAPPRRGR
jgi:tRNA(Ile)-lysidine synthase